jgi:hypothetical protein
MRSLVTSCVIILAFVILLPGPASAQDTGAGTLIGVVTDPTGSVVPNAKISVTGTATQQVRTSTTDASGNYIFPALPFGSYDVTVNASGFATIRNTGLAVSVGTTTRLNVTLQVASSNQEISVAARADLVNSSNAETGGLFNPIQVTNLPLNGRNFLSLVSLVSGVRNDTSSSRQSFVINGAPPHQGINFMVDGTDATGIETGEIGGISTSSYQSTFTLGLDSIAEFVIHSSTFSAKYGRALGGVIETVTKSGTNAVHGNIFYYLRHNILNANTIQANAAGLPRPELRFNQYGANSGGPILRNKLFFWLGYEGLVRRTGVTNTYTVLSALGRASVIDPQIKSFVDTYLPLPDRPPTSNPNLALLVRNDVTAVQEDIGAARIDYNFSDADNLFFRYNIHQTDASSPVLGGFALNPGRQQLATLSETHVFSPSMTANLRLGFNRPVTNSVRNLPNPGISLSSIFTIAGNYLHDFPQSETIAGDFTKIKGPHTLQFGFELRWTVDSRIQDNGSTFTFFGGANQLPNLFKNLPDQLSQTDNIGGNAGFSGNYSFYFQDDYRVSRKLTLNMGLRWDYFLRPSERFGRVVGVEGSAFPVSRLHFKQPGQPLIPQDFAGFGPRFGFAYSLNDKTVIRGGAGIFVGNNYPAMTTAATSTYVPPSIPANLFNPAYTRSIDVFNRATTPNLTFPDNSFITPSQILQTLPPPSPIFVAPDWKNTNAYQWSMRVERALGANSTLSAGYNATRSVHVIGQDVFNVSRPLLGNTRENPLFGPISFRGTFNNAFYNGMETTFTHRFTKGLQFDANYTWSHVIDDIFGYAGQNDPGVTPQTNSRQMQRGNSAFDRRHEFKADYYYDLPLGKSWAGRGWNVGGIVRISSGAPYTVVTGATIGDGSHVQRPNLLCSNPSTGQSPGLFTPVLNPACFAVPSVPDPASGFFIGSLGRDTFTGPTSMNYDLNITKSTRITERFTHEFRAEFFNLFNNTNFNVPATALNDPNFGKILGAAAGREIQFAMKLLW